MRVKLWVKTRDKIQEPQGAAVMGVLHHMGYASVQNVRVGKLIEVELNETDKQIAEQLVQKMAKDLLANWVMEDFEIIA